jgi:hypothetical protein
MWFAPQMQARFIQTRLASRIHARAWGKRSSGMLRSTLGALIQDYSKPPTPRRCKFCQLVHSLFSISVRQIGSPQMKISFSRSSLLTAIAIVILLSALPGAIRRVMQSGDPYLFTQRFFEDLWARLLGPGRLRFILQPTAAILLGVRDGKRDARIGRPPFLSGLVFPTNPQTKAVAKFDCIGPRPSGHRYNPGRHFPNPHLPGDSSWCCVAAGARVDNNAVFCI